MSIKSSIKLSDYDFKQDIKHRLLLSRLEVDEIDILREILDHSLKFSLEDFAEEFDYPELKIRSALQKLSACQLFTLQGDTICINKDQRRYFEQQILKFEDRFEPNLDYLQSLFSKIPIHVLPEWYEVSSTGNLFQFIINKYFATPKHYETYINELKVGQPWVADFIEEIYQAAHFEVDADSLKKKFNLTSEEFHERILQLEFQLVCCLSYKKENNVWKEVVTPFHEWRDYLCFLRDRKPQPITSEPPEVLNKEEFAFLQELTTLLQLIQQNPWPVKEKNGKYVLQEAVFSSLPTTNFKYDSSTLVDRLLLLQLANIEKEHLVIHSSAKNWLKFTMHEKSSFLHRYWLRRIIEDEKLTIKDLNEIEKCLNQLRKNQWYFLDDFLYSLTVPIGKTEPISLKNQGKKWKYHFFDYGPHEFEIVESLMFGVFHEAGHIVSGMLNNKKCFCVRSR